MVSQINTLLIGSGGREHAIAETLVRTSKNKFFSINSSNDTTTLTLGQLFITPGNVGMKNLANLVDINTSNHKDVYDFCRTNDISLIIVGPETPLANGIVDDIYTLNKLNNTDIQVFGPEKYAANLEASKAFSKDFMYRHNIPTALYKNFTKEEKKEAIEFTKSLSLPLVIKADGLATGKGVIIAETYLEAENVINEMFNGMFGKSGDNIVIEEFMLGQEASIFAICDGNDYLLLSSAQDHKRVFDNDKGKNTGGMGAYSPAPIVTTEILRQVEDLIIKPVLKGIKQENSKYIGCLYVGLMIDNNTAKVVEFNSRFGDPETQVVLPIFQGNLLELFYTAAKGNINKNTQQNTDNNQFATTVILASSGYPDEFEKGNEITGIQKANELTGVSVFFAGVSEKNGTLVNSGGRVLAVTAIADSLKKSIEQAYNASDLIHFSNKYNRTDIGQKGLSSYNNKNFIK